MLSHVLQSLEERDVLRVEPSGEGKADEMGRYGVAIGSNGHDTFPIHQNGVKHAVVMSGRRKGLEVGTFLSEQRDRKLPGSVARPTLIDVAEPGGTLLGEVLVVVEGPTGEEVVLDELDETFDGTFLVASGRGTHIGMEVELRSEFLEGRMPDGLVLGVSA